MNTLKLRAETAWGFFLDAIPILGVSVTYLGICFGLLAAFVGVYLAAAWCMWWLYVNAAAAAIPALPKLGYWHFVGCWLLLTGVVGLFRSVKQ